MKQVIEKFRQAVIVILVIAGGFAAAGCSGNKGKTLTAEPVDEYIPEQTEPHVLFKDGPANITALTKYSGVVDTIGTTLVNDLDGDGIINAKEGLLNAWVADYPVLETYIAPPVTMKIEILYKNETETTIISSEISATDVTSATDQSSDTAHREEINLRTVQFQDSYNQATSSDYKKETSSNRSTGVKAFASMGGTGGGNTGTGGSAGANSGGTTPGGSGLEVYGGSFGYNYSRQSSSIVANSYEDAYGETKTKWTNIPFKNNLNKRATHLKRDAAAKNSHNLRRKLNNTEHQVEKIMPNAGYVRAALYITNESVNMPVHMSNLLCSFMLEAPDGQLVPVQSFRLRDDDNSLFEFDLYGGDTFGPYVIELNNLNTYEIREAIANGYNPKIFIVNYTMTHVADSNYRDLLDFRENPEVEPGDEVSDRIEIDNLKIIEENAKGRTAGVKIVGPNIRRFFRVAAFNTDGVETRTGVTMRDDDSNGQIDIRPGVHLEKALERITYSGLDIEYAFYMLDFSGIEPEMEIDRFIVRGIKSINGIQTKIPLKSATPQNGYLAGIDADGNPVPEQTNIDVYIMKPITEWEDPDYENFKMWTVFADGKYYMHSADLVQTKPDGTLAPRTFNYEGQDIKVVEGIQSMIWPGDHYDIVYLDLTEYLGLIDEFGNNPIEKVTSLNLNTRWNLSYYGDNPDHYFYPDTNSYYLGDVGLGDTIQFDVTLDRTGYLDPSFGTGVDSGEESLVYNNFTYRIDESQSFLLDSVNKYTLEEAIDLQISFGLDGKMSDWVNLVPSKNLEYDPDYEDVLYFGQPQEKNGVTVRDEVIVFNRSWDFQNQEYSFAIQMPYTLHGVGDDQMVSIYLRTAPHNVYREVVWPLPAGSIKKFRGKLAVTAHPEDNQVVIRDTVGTPSQGDKLYICNTEECADYTINSVSSETDDSGQELYTIELTGLAEHFAGEGVYIDHAVTPAYCATLSVDNDFIALWNVVYSEPLLFDYFNLISNRVPLASENTNAFMAYCDDLGLGYVESAWAGGNNFSHPGWNSWSDASQFDNLEDSNFNDKCIVSVTHEDEVSTMKVSYSDSPSNSELKTLFFKAPLLERDYTVQARFVDYRPNNGEDDSE